MKKSIIIILCIITTLLVGCNYTEYYDECIERHPDWVYYCECIASSSDGHTYIFDKTYEKCVPLIKNDVCK